MARYGKREQAAIDACWDTLMRLKDEDDQEIAHGEADEAILKLLSAIGLDTIHRAYESVRDAVGGFWYA